MRLHREPLTSALPFEPSRWRESLRPASCWDMERSRRRGLQKDCGGCAVASMNAYVGARKRREQCRWRQRARTPRSLNKCGALFGSDSDYLAAAAAVSPGGKIRYI